MVVANKFEAAAAFTSVFKQTLSIVFFILDLKVNENVSSEYNEPWSYCYNEIV